MSIKEYVKRMGWNIFCDVPASHRYQTVQIGFKNDLGHDDETEFEIKAYDLKELTALFREFCKENNYSPNRVTYVTIVNMSSKPMWAE